MEPIDLKPCYTSSQIPGKCLKCLTEQCLDGCLRELLTRDGEEPELVEKYSTLLSFLQSRESVELRDQAERLLAEGKEVMLRIQADGDKTSYTLEVDGPDNNGEG